MDPDFWHRRWERNEIGFHEDEANAMLVAHFRLLALPGNARVFVPLCGKTRDLAWLLSQGYRVVGAELSQLAIDQLFADLGAVPDIVAVGDLLHYSAPGIDIYVGDIFDLSRDRIGPVDAIYDRAALVALPTDIRDRYAAHIVQITDKAPQFLICFDYDQTLMQGPPFSINADEVARIYSPRYDIARVDEAVVRGGVRGTLAREVVWQLG